MSQNEFNQDIPVFFEDGGDGRGAFAKQPKREPPPFFASEKALLAGLKGVPVSEASLRISQFAFRTNGVVSGDEEARAAWKADYRRIMHKWRAAQSHIAK